MSFGYSISDFIAFTQLTFQVSESITNLHSLDANGLGTTSLALVTEINTLETLLRDIERTGLDNLIEEEISLLACTSRRLFPTLNTLLNALNYLRRPPKRRLSDRDGNSLAEYVQDIAPLIETLRETIAEAQSRLAAQSSPPSTPSTFSRPDILPNLTTIHSPSPPLVITIQLRRPRSCILIITLFLTFTCLSCILGTYFTLDKRYGYTMGDAFTLASWIIAVGALVSIPLVAYHYPHCRCWARAEGDEDRSELQALVRAFEN